MSATEQTIRRFKFFTVDDFEKEQDWLHEMSRAGYHIKSVHRPGFYTFIKSEPCPYFYRLNYRNNTSYASADYLQIFSDAGWDRVTKLGGLFGGEWDYFRKKSTENNTPEIFNDAASQIGLYRRLRNTWTLFFLIVFAGAIGGIYNSLNVIFNRSWSKSTPLVIFCIVLLVLWTLLIFVYVRMLIRLTGKIKQLSSPGNSLIR